EIRRCLDPRHNTKIDRMEAALAILGRRLRVTVEAA
ncbi:MAG: type II toxin-antitoxin system HicB family antitoxin, partial [Rhodospirillaceae bacterium]|nr:type II toxin-antitoxin system HicB family antitoxin [Rhodospirillaceae bacterium]